MTIHNLTIKQKILIIFTSFIFIVIFISLLFIKIDTKYGDGVNINNYDKYASNLPTDRKNSINSSLFNVISLNLDKSNPNIKDAAIRGSSVKYNYNETTNINSGSFIVDIPSIKQSYFITYEWSSDENNVNFSGYTASATCPSVSDLIYGDFNCKDRTSVIKSNSDPILEHLPYSTFNYTITADINKNNKADLNVDMILYSYDTRDGNREASINKYKNEIINWIKSLDLNPDDYLINYSIN